MGTDALSKALSEINRVAFELSHSNAMTERRGAIVLITKLAEVINEDVSMVSRYISYLRSMIPSLSDPPLNTMVVEAITTLLGRSSDLIREEKVREELERCYELARSDSASEGSLVVALSQIESIFRNSQLCLGGNNTGKKYATPVTEEALAHCEALARNDNLLVRLQAARALHTLLSLERRFDTNFDRLTWSNLLEAAIPELRSNDVSILHGALLTIQQLAQMGLPAIAGMFDVITKASFSLLDHKEECIRQVAMDLIPEAATCCPQLFIHSHLDNWVGKMIQTIHTTRGDQRGAIEAIGHICSVVGSHLIPYLTPICDSIRKIVAAKKGDLCEDYILDTITSLSASCGADFERLGRQLLLLLLQCRLSESLITSIGKIVSRHERLWFCIEDSVVELISDALGATETRFLALQAIEAFCFSDILLLNDYVGERLLEIINEPISPSSSNIALLLQATKAILSILGSQTAAKEVESDVICKSLLSVVSLLARYPENSELCKVIIERLINFPSLHKLLSFGPTLFILSTSHWEQCSPPSNQILDLVLLRKLSCLNPADVLIVFRKRLLACLSELSLADGPRRGLVERESSVSILHELSLFPCHWVCPYSASMLEKSLECIRSSQLMPDADILISHCVKAISNIIDINLDVVEKYLQEIFGLFYDLLNESHTPQRQISILSSFSDILKMADRSKLSEESLPKLLITLFGLLKIELNIDVRMELLRLFGVVGSIDPFRIKMFQMRQSILFVQPIQDGECGERHTELKREDDYHDIAFRALLKILQDPVLTEYHMSCTQCITFIIKEVGPRSKRFLNLYIPCLQNIIIGCQVDFLEFYFQQIVAIAQSVGIFIKPFVPQLISLAECRWSPEKTAAVSIMTLLEMIVVVLKVDSVDYIPRIVSILLGFHQYFLRQRRSDSMISQRTSLAIHKFSSAITTVAPQLGSYSGLVFRSLLSELDHVESSDALTIKSSILLAVQSILCSCDVNEHLTTLCRILSAKWESGCLESVNDSVIDVFLIIWSVNRRFDIFNFLSSKKSATLREYIISSPSIEIEVRRITGKLSSMYIGVLIPSQATSVGSSSGMIGNFYDVSFEHTSGMNIAILKRAFDVAHCSSKEAWFEWLRKLGIELLRESPSGSLRICASLASFYFPLNKELFNAAFLSCWEELTDEEQRSIAAGTIEAALGSASAPAELIQSLLDLAEYMEHLERAFPISMATLGTFAMKNHAFAKALYYREEEFKSCPSVGTLESLVTINSHIQNQDGAFGILSYSQKKFGITLTESWYEKLQRWEDALVAYELKLARDPSSDDALLGVLRCRFSLGEWKALNDLAEQRWESLETATKLSVAPLACASSWAVNNFDAISRFVGVLPIKTDDGSFFRAIYAIHQKQYDFANQLIRSTREIMDTELTALIGESYGRAYISSIRVQMLSDLEEVIEYAKFESAPRRERIKKSLLLRLLDCQENIDVWQRLLKIRNLVIPMHEDRDLWIKFAQMAQESQRSTLANAVLLSLMNDGEGRLADLDVGAADHNIAYAFIQHRWHLGEKVEARDALFRLANYLSLKIESQQATSQQIELQRLVSRCFVTLGQWQQSLGSGNVDEIVLQYYLQATSFDKTWYHSWHSWALANYEAASLLESESRHEQGGISFGDLRHRTNPYIVPAIQGFFRSIGTAPHSAIQDSLRLLTLWFKYGALPEVNAAIGDGFASIPVANWLAVLPQLIARIHVTNTQVRRMIHSVLSDIGKQHPQALVYPLAVASKSQNVSRRTSAIALLEKIKSHSAILVEEAQMISNELIRVAILWEEMWYEGLEEASRMYFGEQNVPPMLAILEPLHSLLDRGPETPREQLFVKTYGDELREAKELCKRYRKSGNMDDITSAWELYYQVFRRINKALPLMTSIDLEQASPRLAATQNISLAVPGTFLNDCQSVSATVNAPVIRICKITERLKVIASKQRPRKLAFLGSDGKWHKFLLKGHEDLRQDERVMQFFGLMNSLLSSDGETRKRHLGIQMYSVIPLSQNSGLIGWVTHCDTMHTLIKEYREARGIQLSLEHRLMLQISPDYDHLTRLQKIEAFTWAMQNSEGEDLARIFWLKSSGAEAWLERRTMFIRSVAVMSMVGYVLGLGDRHPSNLMIDQETGRVVHIDFGDCFEVAMLRDKFPERVPFRLTRMMQKAFEASGVDGTFRVTCEHTMRVMRENKDSLMAILEAFIYDPLINWRLLSHSSQRSLNPQQARPSFFHPSMVINTSNHLNNTNASASNRYNEAAVMNGRGNFPDEFSLAKRQTREESNRLEEESVNKVDNVHAGALNALTRVGSKLTGRDFKHADPLSIVDQVDLLIIEATMVENLCQAYVGWCSFW